MPNVQKIYLAIPVLNESVNIPKLMDCLEKQDNKNFEAVFCVNQYDHWWEDENHIEQCDDNQKSIAYLNSVEGCAVTIIDKSSKGKGWPKKKGGVGWARKISMDHISEKADNNDLIVCMDADTFYPPDYLSKVAETFAASSKLVGLSIPYYHPLQAEKTQRLILRYEIYMRYYLLNMLRIGNPYAFTALGSAMAAPVWAYRKIGGLTPVKSGEDFYFIQKLIKNGPVSIWSEAIAYPSSRFSGRVLFGTGPALIKGSNNDWGSYPVYPIDLFDDIKKTFDAFPNLFEQKIATPMDGFLAEVFKNDDIWQPLRINYKDLRNFVRACENKVDGLRILQYLKQKQKDFVIDDCQVLIDFLHKFYPDKLTVDLQDALEGFDFDRSDINSLSQVRDFLFRQETAGRFSHFQNYL